MSQPTVAVVGAGRAGSAFAASIPEVGWNLIGPLTRNDDLAETTKDADLVLLCVSDSAIEEVASELGDEFEGVVAHVAGSVGIDALPDRFARGALHPLVSIPLGASADLLMGPEVTFAVEGDALVTRLAEALGARTVEVDADKRALYHAAACITSNHLVALMGQVERVGLAAGLDLDAFMQLATQTLHNVKEMGPAASLTGPAARGDVGTIKKHMDALDARERDTYRVLSEEAARLSGLGF